MSLPGAAPDVHPFQTASALSSEDIERLLLDNELIARVNREVSRLDHALAEPEEPTIAYCSPEFGITSQIPQYAGGLGILAGDHLKTASDLRLPLAGVGLFYRYGVFRQQIDNGGQTETYDEADPKDFGATDTGVIIDVPMPGRDVSARVWRLDVGRIPLILLDTHVETNSGNDQHITDRLYMGSTQHRLEQEMVLGVGGARALAALGWAISIHHLNEGHAGFLTLELIDRVLEDRDVDEAVDAIKGSLLFTTHTPVPAGIDRFERSLIAPYLEHWSQRWGVGVERLMDLGRDPKERGRFNMAGLCLRTSGAANGVSALHGEVSRKLFAGVGLGDRIGHVTNGVHSRTWTAPHCQDLFDEALGPTWADGDPEAWGRVGEITLDRLDSLRHRSSSKLSELVLDRTGHELDPDSLVIGFARRFAPYKRATLLMREAERLTQMLTDDHLPIHFVFAGKAHPSDGLGKQLVSELITFSDSPGANRRLTFIPDYDMEIARAMVQGCDVWLNNPIRPREASGTSGQKATLNGSLNCSILDGWWAEMFDGQNGWQIEASDATDPDIRDSEEAVRVLDTIDSIAQEYHSARMVFNGRIRHSWQSLGPLVTSARMLRDYQQKYYIPALERSA